MPRKKIVTTEEPAAVEQPAVEKSPRKGGRSWSVNRVHLTGRLVAEPELRYTGNGKPVASLRIATNDTKVAEFHDVVVWGERAETYAEFFHKADPVCVEGRLRTQTWTGKDGLSRRTTQVIAQVVHLYAVRSA